jgi:hypothetical protein
MGTWTLEFLCRPAHHNLKGIWTTSINAAGIRGIGKSPLFRSVAAKAPKRWRRTKARARQALCTGDEITLDEVERIRI